MMMTDGSTQLQTTIAPLAAAAAVVPRTTIASAAAAATAITASAPTTQWVNSLIGAVGDVQPTQVPTHPNAVMPTGFLPPQQGAAGTYQQQLWSTFIPFNLGAASFQQWPITNNATASTMHAPVMTHHVMPQLASSAVVPLQHLQMHATSQAVSSMSLAGGSGDAGDPVSQYGKHHDESNMLAPQPQASERSADMLLQPVGSICTHGASMNPSDLVALLGNAASAGNVNAVGSSLVNPSSMLNRAEYLLLQSDGDGEPDVTSPLKLRP